MYHHTESSPGVSIYKFKHDLIKQGILKNQEVIEHLYDEPVVPQHLQAYYRCAVSLIFNAPSNGFSQSQPSLTEVSLQAELEGLDTSKLLRFVRALYPQFSKWVAELRENTQTNTPKPPKVGRK